MRQTSKLYHYDIFGRIWWYLRRFKDLKEKQIPLYESSFIPGYGQSLKSNSTVKITNDNIMYSCALHVRK